MQELMSPQEVLQNLQNLTDETQIFVSIDPELSNRLELTYMKLHSMENLFTAYINGTSEKANDMNLQKFIDEYTRTVIIQDDAVKDVLINLMGVDVYRFIFNPRNNMEYLIDFKLNSIIFSKVNSGSCTSCRI